MNQLRERSDSGASSVEYGLMLAGIAAVIVAIVFAIGLVTEGQFAKTSDCVVAEAASTC